MLIIMLVLSGRAKYLEWAKLVLWGPHLTPGLQHNRV